MNKQTRLGRNTEPNFCVRNGGANPILSPVVHGRFAFQDAAQAVSRKKVNGSRSWRVTGKHPTSSNRNK